MGQDGSRDASRRSEGGGATGPDGVKVQSQKTRTRRSTPGGRESAAAQAGLRESAALGVAGFGICELCWGTAREPAPVAIIMLVYLVVMLVGMSLYGVEAWTRNADPLGVYFSLFGSLAPIARHDGALYDPKGARLRA